MNERFETYLTHLSNERGLSPNTVSAYRNDLSQLEEFLTVDALRRGEDLLFQAVTREHLGGFFLGLRERGYAPATMARKIAALKSFFHYLRDQGLIASDPTLGIGAPDVKKSVPHSIGTSDVAALFASTAEHDSPDGARDLAMVRLLYSTGMRVGELTALDVRDVDLSGGSVRVLGRGGRERNLPLDASTSASLRLYVTRARPYLARHNRDETALVLNHRGQRLTRQGFWLIMKALAKNSGLDGTVTPHTLRHSFAAHQVKEGLALEQLRQLLGHASISTTQMYSQARPPSPAPIPIAERSAAHRRGKHPPRAQAAATG